MVEDQYEAFIEEHLGVSNRKSELKSPSPYVEGVSSINWIIDLDSHLSRLRRSLTVKGEKYQEKSSYFKSRSF